MRPTRTNADRADRGGNPARRLVLAALLGVLLGTAAPAPPAAGQGEQGDSWAEQRHRMVEEQIRARGITQPEVLSAMDSIPRHLFVPDAVRARPTPTIRCRSTTARRSPSPTSSP